jgi:hypothetical protein
MEYKVVERRLVDDGKNPYWMLKLWGDHPKKIANVSTEELNITRSKDDGDLMPVGTVVYVLASHEPVPESVVTES